jgi:UDP-2-acetamido-2-deoxy-ribo-hexuluronate aminotransferase
LSAVDIPTTMHYSIPLNRQPVAKDEHVLLPVGDRIAARVMNFPMHPYLSDAAQQQIVEQLQASLKT